MRRIVSDVLNSTVYDKQNPEDVLQKLYELGSLPNYVSINELGQWEIEESKIHEFASKYL